MAEFNYNNGNITTVEIDSKYEKTKVYITAEITIADSSVKIAGHSIINLDGDISFEDVQFLDHLLDYSFNLFSKTLKVLVDVSKFNVGGGDVTSSGETATCKLTINAGNNLLNDYKISDSDNSEDNSVFNFLFTFSKV